MKKPWKALVIGAMAVGLGSASVHPAYGFGNHRGGPGGMMMGGGPGPGMLFPTLLRTLDLTPAQKGQVAEIMQRHRGNMEPLFGQLRTAHDELAKKLFAPGTVSADDLAPTLERLGQLKQQLLKDWAQAALETRAVLTPAQLARAADVKQRLDALHGEMEKLLGPLPGPPDGGPAE